MSKVVLKYIGVSRRNGVSEKTGNAYDICVLNYASELVPASKQNMTFVCHGSQQREIGLTSNLLNLFSDVPFGSDIEIVMGADPQNLSKSIVSDFLSYTFNGKTTQIDKQKPAF